MFKTPPMNVTDLTIETLGPKGDGISAGSRGRVYIDRGLPGDRVQARVRRDAQGIARGEIVQVLEPSPYRQKGPCLHYDHCGSCTLQHLDPKFYRAWKLEMVREAFHNQGLRPKRWMEPVFLGTHNRRRAVFSAMKSRGKIVLGYYRRRSNDITDVDSCLIAEPRLLSMRDTIKPCLNSLLIENQTVDIFLQLVGEAMDIVFTGPIGRRGEPDGAVRETLKILLETHAAIRIGWRAREGDRIETMGSRGVIAATFGDLTVALPAAAFLQPTVEGELALQNAVMQAVPARGTFADLFSGCGTFSGPLLGRGPVDAYESNLAAVKALSKAARTAPLKVFGRDLFGNPLRRSELNRYDAVMFDPPRAGCREQVEEMASARTPLLIGVSCNPATFARDARILCDGGYWLQSLQVIDQFLWSHHVEMVGVFTKKRRH